MRIRLVLLDIDGVLIKRRDASISPKVVTTIKQIPSSVRVSLCTGRVKHDIQSILDELKLNYSYHVIEGGAKVLNPLGEEENIKTLPLADVDWIVEVAGDSPAGYGFCVEGRWLDRREDINKDMVTIVSLHSHNQVQTQEILEKIIPVGAKYHIAVGSHWEMPEGNFIMITHPEVSKARAIQYVQEKLGITKEETLGVGDMPNDLPLFERSGIKVAMGNGHEDLKEQADYIAPSIDKDGMVDVIKRFILKPNN